MKKRWKKLLVFAVAVMIAGSGIPFTGTAFAAETVAEEDESVDSLEKTDPEDIVSTEDEQTEDTVEDEQTDVTESVPMQVQSVPGETALEDSTSEGERINIVANGLSEDADLPISVDVDLKAVETGQTVTVTAEEVDGYYLAQIRIGYAPMPNEETESIDMVWETLEVSDHQAQFTMPEGDVTVYGDYVSIVWDGTIDLTWYDEDADTYRLQYAAQMAGAATLANGLFNDFPVRDEILNEGEDNEEVISYPDIVDAEGNLILAPDDSEENVVGYVHKETNSGYEVFEDSDGDGYDTPVVGDLKLIEIHRYSKGSTGGNNKVTTNIRWFGSEHYEGKTVLLTDDIDMGGAVAEGTSEFLPENWSGPNYMPIAGQYAMDAGNAVKKENGYTCLSAYFLGTFDGAGHMVKNICAMRHVNSGIFGNSQAVGMIGLLGHPNSEDNASTPVVQNVAVGGMIYGNRSIGGVVGKNDYSGGSVIRNCINFATVYNTDAKGCGGIIGAGWNDLTVEYCANFGLVCTGYGKNAGGLVGSCEAIVFDSYSLGYATGEGKGNENAGQALGTNNGGAVWYNCYTLLGAGSGTKNIPGEATQIVYGTTYGSAIRVLNTASDLEKDTTLSMLNGRVKNGGTDSNGYMDSDDDVTPNTKRNWVKGDERDGSVDIISESVINALTKVKAWHDPAVDIEDGSLAGIASSLSAVDATGMPIPRTFVHDAASVTDLITTGTPLLSYYSGETFDTGNHDNQSTGPTDTDPEKEFAIWAVFDDGTWQEIEDYEVVYQHDNNGFTVNDTAVTVNASYLGNNKSWTFDVEVESCNLLSLKVTAPAQNVFYAEGETFNPNGMIVTAEYGVTETDPIITIKAKYADNRLTLERLKKSKEHSDQSVVYETTILSGEAAAAYVFDITPQGSLSVDDSEITVTHTFNGETLSATSPITVLDSEAPRMVKDGDVHTVYITSENDFLWFANQVSTKLDPSLNAVLENDVEISNTAFASIGAQKYVKYQGCFDGDGHSITLNTEQNGSAGLFYSIAENGSVKNLTVKGSISGGNNTGSIAGRLDGGTIENCINQASIAGNGKYTGGFVGYVLGTESQMISCKNNGIVSGKENVGGVAGYVSASNGYIVNCSNSAQVKRATEEATGEYGIGGIAGDLVAGTVKGCKNSGAVESAYMTSTGGITGKVSANGTVLASYHTGSVNVTSPEATAEKGGSGGIAGRIEKKATVSCCYSTGKVEIKEEGEQKYLYAGALIGNAYDLSNVLNNYALEGTSETLIKARATLKDENAAFLQEETLKNAAEKLNAGLGNSEEEEVKIGFQDDCGNYPILLWEEAKAHTPSAPLIENKVEPTYTADGHYDSVVYCKDCHKELSRETTTTTVSIPISQTSVSIAKQTYGKTTKPSVTVKYGNHTLKEGTDYTVNAAVKGVDYVNPGNPSVEIVGKGKFTGTKTANYLIQFSDVTDTTLFYYSYIYWAVENNITTGFTDGTFRPMGSCNRAAVVTFLWRMAGRPTPKKMASFKDMTGNPDFDKAISWAEEQGITTGWDDNTFRPWNTCNRAAIVTFLWRYAGRKAPGSSAKFKDMTDNADFDKAISWAAANGITTGWSDNTFRPWNTCNRLAIMSFLSRYNSLYGKF